VGESFEAIPADAFLSDTGFPGVKVSPERLCDSEAATRPAISFTTRIDELTSRNAELEAELEQWKLAVLEACREHFPMDDEASGNVKQLCGIRCQDLSWSSIGNLEAAYLAHKESPGGRRPWGKKAMGEERPWGKNQRSCWQCALSIALSLSRPDR
jgi:hypothetical protein